MSAKQAQQKISSQGRMLRGFLRTQLKLQQKTYAQLATCLGVTETTVKRWMTNRDISVETLNKICSALNLNTAFLIDQCSHDLGVGHFYTEEQEQYFATHPKEFLVFIKLLTGSNLMDVQTQCGYTEARLRKMLRQLETIKVLKLLINNKVEVLIKGPFQWRADGLLEKAYANKLGHFVLSHFLRKHKFTYDFKKQNILPVFRPFEMYLDETNAQEFGKALMQVFYKYRAISRSMKQYPSKKIPVSGVVALDFLDSWNAICHEQLHEQSL